MCVCVLFHPFNVSSNRFCNSIVLARLPIISSMCLYFFPLSFLFFFFNVLSDARSLPVRPDDPALVPVHVLVPVPVPARMVFGLIHVLDLSLAHALCSDRHNTYTSHVSQLSYFSAAFFVISNESTFIMNVNLSCYA